LASLRTMSGGSLDHLHMVTAPCRTEKSIREYRITHVLDDLRSDSCAPLRAGSLFFCPLPVIQWAYYHFPWKGGRAMPAGTSHHPHAGHPWYAISSGVGPKDCRSGSRHAGSSVTPRADPVSCASIHPAR